MSISYCFRQTCQTILELELVTESESWQRVRERLHQKHFGAARQSVDKISRSKFMSGLCSLKGYLAEYDASSKTMVLPSQQQQMTDNTELFPGFCIVLCRTAPTAEIIASEGRYFADAARHVRQERLPRVTRLRTNASDVIEHLSAIKVFAPDDLEMLRKSPGILREFARIREFCANEAEAFRRTAAPAPRIYSESARPAEAGAVNRASGIPSSMLRRAVTEEERSRAMLDSQGNLVIVN